MTTKKEGNGTQGDWSGLDDGVLIDAYLKGDQRAFEVLFQKYYDQVSRLIHSITKDHSLVDDIAQEVFLLVYRHLHKFRGQSAFKTWLYRITVNETLRQAVRMKRWQPLPEGDFEPSKIPSTLVMFENGASPERVLLDGEQQGLIQEALKSLKPAHRTILVLFYMEELSVQEVADILEIPEGSVKSRLYYARLGLKEALQVVMQPTGKDKRGHTHVV